MHPVPLLNWATSASRLLVNPEFLHADVQSFKRLDRNCDAMLVVRMAAFNSLTAFSPRDQQPRAIRLPVLNTEDYFRSSVTRSTIVVSPYNSVSLTNASMQAALRHLRTSELFSRGLTLMICCLARWAFERTALEGSPFASSTEPRYVMRCTRTIHSSSTVSAS